MDVTTSIEGRLPTRPLTARRSTHGARYLSFACQSIIAFDTVEIFKKTRCVADLKPRGRDVAKDVGEVTNIPPQLHKPPGFDRDACALNVKLTGVKLVERKTKWMPPATHHTSGAVGRYAQQIGPALDGAVTRPGGAHEKQCYADI
jgi:hypothetical protein